RPDQKLQTRSFPFAHQIEEFVAGILIVFETAKHRARYRNGMLLFHAAHDHAKMLRFNDYRNAARMNFVIDGFGDLRGQPFLHLKSSGVHINETWNLAQADNAAVRNVPDMTFAEKRKKVMLAQAEHLDIPDDHHLVIGNIEQCPVKEFVGIHAISAGEETHGTVNSFGGINEAVAGWIFADLRQHRPDLFNHPI